MNIRFIYTLFIGVLVALFVGAGIAAFYPSPKMPEFRPPSPVANQPTDASTSALYYQQSQQSINDQLVYAKDVQLYSRNVSVIAVAAAIVILVISIAFFKSILMIADGLMFGGVLTLVYSIFRGFNSNDEKFRFIVVTIGLAIALILGYIKFIKADQRKKK